MCGMSEAGFGMAPLAVGAEEVSSGKQRLAFFCSTHDQPATVFWWTSGVPAEAAQTTEPPVAAASGEEDDGDRYEPFNSSTFVVPSLVSYPSSDGLYTINAQLFLPNADAAEARRQREGARAMAESGGPAVIFTHGGSQRQMYAAFHYCSDYAGLYALNQYFATQGAPGAGCRCSFSCVRPSAAPGPLHCTSVLCTACMHCLRIGGKLSFSTDRAPLPPVGTGYVVLSINYRSGVGYGRDFRLCERSNSSCGWQGGLEYQDVLAGNAWLAARADVDGKRIGIHGLSYGGLNCLQALSRDSDKFSAGACNAPVFNWITELRTDYAGVIGPFTYQPALDRCVE